MSREKTIIISWFSLTFSGTGPMEPSSSATGLYRYDTQTVPSLKRCPSSFHSHWLPALLVLPGWCSSEWSQVEFIKDASFCPVCCVHYLQISLLQCSERLLIMVGISVKSFVYVRGHQPSHTRPVIQPGFLSYPENCLYIEKVKAGVHLVGQKTRPDSEPCRTGWLTTGFK